MSVYPIPQTRPPREHVTARLWWLATATPSSVDNAAATGCPKNNGGPHNHMPTRDAQGNRIYQCTRCGHSFYP